MSQNQLDAQDRSIDSDFVSRRIVSGDELTGTGTSFRDAAKRVASSAGSSARRVVSSAGSSARRVASKAGSSVRRASVEVSKQLRADALKNCDSSLAVSGMYILPVLLLTCGIVMMYLVWKDHSNAFDTFTWVFSSICMVVGVVYLVLVGYRFYTQLSSSPCEGDDCPDPDLNNEEVKV
jgi:hypothetical protein